MDKTFLLLFMRISYILCTPKPEIMANVNAAYSNPLEISVYPETNTIITYAMIN